MPLWIYQNTQFALSRAGGDAKMGFYVDAIFTLGVYFPLLFYLALLIFKNFFLIQEIKFVPLFSPHPKSFASVKRAITFPFAVSHFKCRLAVNLAAIMDLVNPSVKMSKSNENEKGTRQQDLENLLRQVLCPLWLCGPNIWKRISLKK